MIRLKSEKIELIKILTKQGRSLKEISNKVGKGKTTVYYHFKKIKEKSCFPIIVNSTDIEKIGEFIGLFAGDGSFFLAPNYKYTIRLHFNLKESGYVKNLIEEVLIDLFQKKPMIFTLENRLNICYYSKNIYLLIKENLIWDLGKRKTYSVRLKNKNYSYKFRIGFLRGCLDSDGYIGKNKINFATVSTGLSKDIINFLDYLCIDYSNKVYVDKRPNRVPIHHINIRKHHFNRFINIISPRNKKMHPPGFELPDQKG